MPTLHLAMLLKELAELPARLPGGTANAPGASFGLLVLDVDEPRSMRS